MAIVCTLPRLWEELPADILRHVFSRIACRADRKAMAGVCHAWRVTVKGGDRPPHPRQLPWLLRLNGGDASVCCLVCGRGIGVLHAAHLPQQPVDARHARFFGSHDGGWAFLASAQTSGHVLQNFRTNVAIPLPDFMAEQGGESSPIVHLAATLFHHPDHECCLLASVVKTCPIEATSLRDVVYWRMHHGTVASELYRTEIEAMEPEDIIFHKGALLALTRQENLLVWIPEFVDEERGVTMHGPEHRACGKSRIYNELAVQSRYLVESHNNLLMLVRYRKDHNASTEEVKIFQMFEVQMPGENGMPVTRYNWVEMRSLYGDMIFVGRGCSRSYEAANYPGFEEGVYFLDDGSYYREDILFLEDAARQYTSSDNGRWMNSRVDRCFLPEHGPSNYSPPFWVLP
ncbi:hypothetical protein E2562_031731 [Oryza meyeriana var. granulata]|uniref:KIB1-4 beta-propeller domain-containing protein n=1 Tax=Oryza meyeriana var. granulata TaxID=110450 RepID=A0A6G1FE98_9ORYZ|nr:hypothetical protein E2562_031731 [Oryza meyeriana var. granulata]